ncbi:MAG: hypothetical protein ACD_22C00061G0005 [uncultured bacterium]|nr:MAG: hypothetical protein ACD_22C00061G0005 [uncultured bacterium]
MQLFATIFDMSTLTNPFKPGAGHMPPYLAGREMEKEEFDKLLDQNVILQNLILTGLRGIGKTVLLEGFRPLATKKDWLWVGTDFSESVSVTEKTMVLRLITDIALITSNLMIASNQYTSIGFKDSSDTRGKDVYLDFMTLSNIYNNTPGFESDKLKKVLEIVWIYLSKQGVKGLIFAYDEAQTISDHSQDHQYPFSLLIDVFQSTQKKGIPFMLVLTGLPTILTKLIECRTYTERLFRVLVLEKLNNEESKEAILKPIQDNETVEFTRESINLIIKESGGYPYFIQYICKEVYDIFVQQSKIGEKLAVPMDAIIRKLDNDFFAGRWAKATEREKELMIIIAKYGKQEFTVKEILPEVTKSNIKPFGRSQINQMFTRLTDVGLLYKNRKGIYSFAVPLLERYIIRVSSL